MELKPFQIPFSSVWLYLNLHAFVPLKVSMSTLLPQVQKHTLLETLLILKRLMHFLCQALRHAQQLT
jgi:hypothetical protein